MRTLHVMQAKQEFVRGNRVIARTARGMEQGEVLCEATPETIAKMSETASGTIQRLLSSQDMTEVQHMEQNAKLNFANCRRLIRELDLDMDLVDVEMIFGGERMVIYYVSEARIDFRDLVKRLANEFQTRVEMKQIGIRDEAKLLADYGDCGKPVCCNTHLAQMPPVTMRMAKLQKPSLDPNKISGRCGRLKCCLRYEYDHYDEIQRDLPPIGSDILTAEGRGYVLNQEILAEQLLVEMEDRRRILVAATDVLTVLKRGSGERKSRGGYKPEPTPEPTSESKANSNTNSPANSANKPNDASTSKAKQNTGEKRDDDSEVDLEANLEKNRDLDLDGKSRPQSDSNELAKDLPWADEKGIFPEQ
jgi:cell fate regulator YaaT (PSP1 superfamily)